MAVTDNQNNQRVLRYAPAHMVHRLVLMLTGICVALMSSGSITQAKDWERLPDGRVVIKFGGERLAFPTDSKSRESVYFHIDSIATRALAKKLRGDNLGLDLDQMLLQPELAQKTLQEMGDWLRIYLTYHPEPPSEKNNFATPSPFLGRFPASQIKSIDFMFLIFSIRKGYKSWSYPRRSYKIDSHGKYQEWNSINGWVSTDGTVGTMKTDEFGMFEIRKSEVKRGRGGRGRKTGTSIFIIPPDKRLPLDSSTHFSLDQHFEIGCGASPSSSRVCTAVLQPPGTAVRAKWSWFEDEVPRSTWRERDLLFRRIIDYVVLKPKEGRGQ